MTTFLDKFGSLLIQSCISVKTLRILKNNTGPTTIWNYLKPGKEFWTADVTRRDVDANAYFVSEDRDNHEVWPKVLLDARNSDIVMSAFGALLQYLRMVSLFSKQRGPSNIRSSKSSEI